MSEDDGAEEDYSAFELAGAEDEEAPWEDPSPDGALGALFESCLAGDAAEVAARAAGLAPELLNALGPEGDTCLHAAALYGHEGCVEALLAAGADASVGDERHGSPLHDAAAGGYLAVCRRLLASRPGLVAAVDDDGETALHCAARGGWPEVVACLLEAGCDRGVVSGEGRTALQCVDLEEDAETAAALA